MFICRNLKRLYCFVYVHGGKFPNQYIKDGITKFIQNFKCTLQFHDIKMHDMRNDLFLKISLNQIFRILRSILIYLLSRNFFNT